MAESLKTPQEAALQVDYDPQETQEWREALDGVIEKEGGRRAHFLIEQLIGQARETGIDIPYSATTEYINTIPVTQQPPYPGDPELEEKIRSCIRWNAVAMVVRANKHTNVGGHIASFASSAVLYDVGFNHFWRATNQESNGDMIYFQGHSVPGVYARSLLLGRISEDEADHFRQEVDGKGISSYPHPWLMPDFWQFPTVSMGLGPLQAIYSARFMKYLDSRGLIEAGDRKVWAFLGDGEIDEVESLGAIGMAARERLDNLIFVINCNLQRLDGPVRGNGKVIQELESQFRGAGWNVIKLIWGTRWDALFARDKKGILKARMMECVDGEYQTFKAKNGAYVREFFFNTPELKELVADWTDEDIWSLNRGGHDTFKVFSAFKAASECRDRPTVILAKTIKGYGMGEAGEAMNIAHQAKKMGHEALKRMRDRFHLPVPDDRIDEVPYLVFPEGSPELNYMRGRRMALGGYLPTRRKKADHSLPVPGLDSFGSMLSASGTGREFSTTMVLVRILNQLIKDKALGRHIVPIVPDESRTFGMEGMFRQHGIWNQLGQNYVPEDHDQLMFYRESKDGQILQEGINEAGAMADWIAAATSYSTHNVQMVPFYICYSMFGMQRTMDLAWAAADQRARGFLIGGTSGRTTLNGEGLQHEDGHSHLLSAVIPNCISFDPSFSYELAVIVQDGLRRMVAEQEDVYYYITVMNENYEHPEMPPGAAPDILKGMYLLSRGGENSVRVQLLGCGAILREVIAAAALLRDDWGVEADIWSCPSFTELARDGQETDRWNLMHPLEATRKSHVERCLDATEGPVIAATDYVRLFSEQIRPWVGRRYVTLGTDGFGRSDTREKLRHFFEVDRHWVTLAALKALADGGVIGRENVLSALLKYRLDAKKPNPMHV
ncbi:MAG: pyruvate dehydrogenase (acetyl-transferring), homodimeric type [Betaproteobacteria bacterium]|nr:pyruvate dehydrogenase (acetyl-transferring), homodimeric type [Betaproteobacteria bacterium]